MLSAKRPVEEEDAQCVSEGKRLVSKYPCPKKPTPSNALTVLEEDHDDENNNFKIELAGRLLKLTHLQFQGQTALMNVGEFKNCALFREVAEHLIREMQGADDVQDSDIVENVIDRTHISKRQNAVVPFEVRDQVAPLNVTAGTVVARWTPTKKLRTDIESFHEENGWIKRGVVPTLLPPWIYEESGRDYLATKLLLSLFATSGTHSGELGKVVDVRVFGREVVELFQSVFDTKRCMLKFDFGQSPFVDFNYSANSGSSPAYVMLYIGSLYNTVGRPLPIRFPYAHLFPTVKYKPEEFKLLSDGIEVAFSRFHNSNEATLERLHEDPFKRTIDALQNQWPTKAGRMFRFESSNELAEHLEEANVDDLFLSIHYLLENKRLGSHVKVQLVAPHLTFVNDTIASMHEKNQTYWVDPSKHDDPDSDPDYVSD